MRLPGEPARTKTAICCVCSKIVEQRQIRRDFPAFPGAFDRRRNFALLFDSRNGKKLMRLLLQIFTIGLVIWLLFQNSNIRKEIKKMSTKTDELKTAVSELKTAVSDEMEQISAKLDELENGADLDEAIADIRATTERIKGIVADAPGGDGDGSESGDETETGDESGDGDAADDDGTNGNVG